MKKIVILIACITLSLLLFSGCSEADLPESFKQSNTITRADASAVALSNIGVSKEDTTYTVVTENLNLEQPCYDVEILVDGVLYRYRIDASRGDLIKITRSLRLAVSSREAPSLSTSITSRSSSRRQRTQMVR